jgi:ABC-type branched-subunit amino acid transport system ATPase component
MTVPDTERRPILELDRVTKRFGGLPAVADVSLKVDEGEIVALVGPNGAGKSTLLKTVSGLEAPTGGRIIFRGADIAGLPPHRVRRAGIAMVEQTPRTFGSMTTALDVAVGAMFGGTDGRLSEHDAIDRAGEALAFVGLAHRADQPVSSLNLHQQRFLELARALAGRPKLLLVDEVMAGLNDTELQASIDIVRTARDLLGITVIWVEHVMKAVMSLAERVAVLNFGHVLADGRPDEVMREPAVVTAYLGEAAHHDA